MGGNSKEPGAARIYVCRGSDCKKRSMSKDQLSALAGVAEIHVVGCQKVCKAPVVGLEDRKGPRWFKRVDDDKAHTALERWARTGVLKKALEKRESRKRAGKLKGKGKAITPR